MDRFIKQISTILTRIRLPGHLPSWILALIGIQIYSLAMGQDLNWDLLNYHYYNGYSFINSRSGFDILPAGIQTGHHPLMDILFYVLIKNLAPIFVAITLTLIQSLNLILIYKIITKTTSYLKIQLTHNLRLLLALISFVGAGMLGNLGGIMGDNLVSITVLLTVYIQISILSLNKEASIKHLLLISLTTALSISLKMTVLVILPGIIMGIFLFKGSIKRRSLNALIIFPLLVLLFFIIFQGYWMYIMYQTYGSPLFPYFNSLFQSPFIDTVNFYDKRFLPQSWWKAILYPVLIIIRPVYVSEVTFLELRFGILYLFALGTFVFALIKKRIARLIKVTSLEAYLFLFFTLSFISWEITSGIYRYIIYLEILAPLLILLVYTKLKIIGGFTKKSAFIISIVFWIMIILLPLSVRPQIFFRIPWQTTNYFGLELKEASQITNSTILMAEGQPYSYIIPFFAESNRFVRISKLGDASEFHEHHKEVVQEIINESRSFYFLYVKGETPDPTLLLTSYKLRESSECLDFSSVDKEFNLCMVVKEGN